jgi:NAD(P) transhydrogenase
LIEATAYLGGAGVNTGTIPSKTLRESALYYSGLRQRGMYGIDYSLKQDVAVQDFLYREQEVVRSLREVIRQNVERHKIDLYHGRGTFEDAHTLTVAPIAGGAPITLRGDVILIATGSVPSRGRGIPFEDPRVYDSDEILEMQKLPRTMAVVGAGVIGCEYATIFAALGIRVTVIDGRDRLLSFLDGEIAELLRMRMTLLGCDVRLNDSVGAYSVGRDGVKLDCKRAGAIEVDSVLVAAGRLGNTTGLGCDRIGLPVGDRGHLSVNELYQTVVPHIYAAGDVIGFPALAATSMEQARVAMVHAFDLKYKTRIAPIFPLAVYTIPEVAMVGETEESCRDKKLEYCVGRSSYRTNPRGQIVGDLDGQLKLVFRADDRRLLGVHVIGESAAELVHVGMLVLQFDGTIDAFINAVFNYPTLGDAYKYAAYDGLGALARRASAP